MIIFTIIFITLVVINFLLLKKICNNISVASPKDNSVTKNLNINKSLAPEISVKSTKVLESGQLSPTGS